MLTNNLGYPRIGDRRELKRASEAFWAGNSSLDELLETGKSIRLANWKLQEQAGIDLIPSNDFSYYDHVLDHSFLLGCIPDRYQPLQTTLRHGQYDLYFAMARGWQKDGVDIKAMEMNKWFDTNYHYIVPEFVKNQSFAIQWEKVFQEFSEAGAMGILTKPVLLGPVSYLLLGKEKEPNFHRLDLLPSILPLYSEIVSRLSKLGAEWIQIDEPFLALDLDAKAVEAYRQAYLGPQSFLWYFTGQTLLTTYFEGLEDNLKLAMSIPSSAIHIDLVRRPNQLEPVLNRLPERKFLSVGIVDGRNIWKNDFGQSLALINLAKNRIGNERLLISPSCSLLHSPCDLDLETNGLNSQLRNWLAFAKQKLDEVTTLAQLASASPGPLAREKLEQNRIAHESRRASTLIHTPDVKKRAKPRFPLC